ncbi:hypothetical protein C8Q80DRAFT_485209 [Daedaleopsis nitida]|nr:hypothetical protein C8Q80DRAFT_485209 [Daedaleopsis nitida]
MFGLHFLALSLSVAVVYASPFATPATDSLPVAPTANGTIDVSQCTANLLCCLQTFSLPDSSAASITSLLPLPTGLPFPVDPLVAAQCSPATDPDIFGNQCLNGGTPLCCELISPGGLAAAACEPVSAVGLPTSLPVPAPTSLPVPISTLPASDPLSDSPPLGSSSASATPSP